jgi:two-component system CheB/CheR fusion protein
MQKRSEQAERDVQEPHHYAESIVATVREPLVVLDGDLRILSASRSFYGTFGVTREGTEGELLYRIDSGQWDIPVLRDLLERVIPQDTTVEDFEVEHDFPNIGRRVMLLNARRMRKKTKNTPALLLAMEDVTERRRAEQAVRDGREAELANHAKSAFLANISHELRTPLNAILGFSEMMSDQMFGPLGHDRYREYVEYIQAGGHHLLRIVNELLDMSKLEAGAVQLEEEEVDVARAIEDSVHLVEEQAKRAGVDICTEIARPLSSLRVDQHRLKQILINLLSNAVKFSTSGRRVVVEAGVDRSGTFDIVVRDNGIGIRPEDLPKVLAPFGQVEDAMAAKLEGTGLGLPLAKALCELLGGTFDLKSKAGVGTKVSIRFPEERVIR